MSWLSGEESRTYAWPRFPDSPKEQAIGRLLNVEGDGKPREQALSRVCRFRLRPRDDVRDEWRH